MLRRMLLVFMVGLLMSVSLVRVSVSQAQQPSPEQVQAALARVAEIAGSYGFDEATFMQLVGELQQSRDPQVLAETLDRYGVDAVTMNAFMNDINTAGLTPALGTMLDLSLIGEIGEALDGLAAEEFLGEFELSEADLQELLAELDELDPSEADAAFELESGDLLYFLYVLGTIDAFDPLIEAADFDEDEYYADYAMSVDPLVLLEFYGLDEESLGAMMAEADFSDPAALNDYLWSLGWDPNDVALLLVSLQDDPDFEALLTDAGLDQESLFELAESMVLLEMAEDLGMSPEELDAFLTELMESDDPEAVLEAYGFSLEDFGDFEDFDDMSDDDMGDDDMSDDDMGDDDMSDDDMGDDDMGDDDMGDDDMGDDDMGDDDMGDDDGGSDDGGSDDGGDDDGGSDDGGSDDGGSDDDGGE